MASFVNISGETTQLLMSGLAVNSFGKISLANVHADTACTVDLFVSHPNQGDFYLLKKVQLPVGATLIYNDFNFREINGSFSLNIKLTKSASETPTVDVILS